MPFYRSANGKWEFDSDYYTSPGLDIPVQGGFYPAEGKTDAMVLAVDPKQKPVPAARTKRNAEGPVFWGPLLRELDPSEQVPIIDLFCKGPGWSKGYDCEGSFAEGEETTERINETLKLGTGLIDACVFGWSCDIDGYAPEGWPMFVQGSETASTGNSSYSHRWTSSEENSKGNGGRNQHFCFESHAKFAFKRGLRFSIRGDDDIWVFINNKLAVDLGGTHLSTPGYVDLDFFMKDAKVDSIYDIDVFFCDRRTTMSNMRISTNIYMYQDEEITDLPTSSSSSAKATSSTSTKSSDSKNAKSSSSVSGSKSKSSSSTTKDSKSSASKNSKSSSSNKDAKSKSSSSSTKYYAKPSFHVEMVAPFEFDIVFDDDTPSLAKQYAVMDMKGQVLFTGELSSADTRVKVPTSGSYIVSVGYNYRQVNVK
jgi:fibro-slime domain-containing protein